MPVYVGLDIGGTKLLVAAADHNGNILRRLQKTTPRALDEGIALLKQMTHKVAAGDVIRAIGAAAGGPLDWESGVVISNPSA